MGSSRRCGSRLAVLCVLLSLTTGGYAWVNGYDQQFSFTCPVGQGINHMISQHSNYHEDRLFDFSCVEVSCRPNQPTCTWTYDYVNDFDKPVVFMCPADNYLAGVESIHSNRYEDRRYKFQCCGVRNGKFHYCSSTDWLNNFDKNVNHTASENRVLTGMASYHDNSYEDRRFKLFECACRN